VVKLLQSTASAAEWSRGDDNELGMKVDLPPERPRLAVPLSDGAEALLSPLSREDRHWIAEGFGELSVQSRYTRFGMGVGGLSAHELDYLADVDQRAHVAWGASVDGRGAGVGRYITTPDTDAPEVAVTVLDAFQGNGLGTILLRALIGVARHDGVEELVFRIMPDNTAVYVKLSSIGATTTLVDGLLEGQIVIADIPEDQLESQLIQVMEEARS